MEKKSKILFYFLFLAIILSVSLTYNKVFVKKDYIVSGLEAPCDPTKYFCFVRNCNSESGDLCDKKDNNNFIYYKIIEKKLKNILPCNTQTQICPDYSCRPGEIDCKEIFCDENNVLEGETCNDPSVYLKDNF